MVDTQAARALEARIASRKMWYHTIELAPGVFTPGQWDHRGLLEDLPWPDVAGKRCLDVGTFDGLYAFELERRGAAEVVAIDLPSIDLCDWPWGRGPVTDAGREPIISDLTAETGFAVAKDALQSSVEWRPLSIYDISPEELGMFDVVTCGSLLLHLRDPILAIQRIRSVCSEWFLSVDAIDVTSTILERRRPMARLSGLSDVCVWWTPNLAGQAQMHRAGGFDPAETSTPFLLPRTNGGNASGIRAQAMQYLVTRSRRRGVPHRGMLSRPRAPQQIH